MVGQRLLRLEIDISIHDVSPVEIENFGCVVLVQRHGERVPGPTRARLINK